MGESDITSGKFRPTTPSNDRSKPLSKCHAKDGKSDLPHGRSAYGRNVERTSGDLKTAQQNEAGEIHTYQYGSSFHVFVRKFECKYKPINCGDGLKHLIPDAPKAHVERRRSAEVPPNEMVDFPDEQQRGHDKKRDGCKRSEPIALHRNVPGARLSHFGL
jgi:hypothetical protein